MTKQSNASNHEKCTHQKSAKQGKINKLNAVMASYGHIFDRLDIVATIEVTMANILNDIELI